MIEKYSRRDVLCGRPMRRAVAGLFDSVFSSTATINDALQDQKPAVKKAAAPVAWVAREVVNDQHHGVDVSAMVIARHCISQGGVACQVCIEHCPEPGAIIIDGPAARVMPDKCTGCRACADVCPAPQNAIRLLPKPNPRAQA